MTLRIALIGAGSVARRHVDVLHRVGGARVVSVTDAHEPAAHALAAELDAVAFTDPERALDAVAADAVYVCVPPFAHGPGERAARAVVGLDGAIRRAGRRAAHARARHGPVPPRGGGRGLRGRDSQGP